MVAQIKRFRRTEFVRFFKDYVECEDCGGETRGRVYSESEQVVCSKCNAVMLDGSEEGRDEGIMVVAFMPDMGDDYE